MANGNLLKTDDKNFMDLMGNGKIYRVPPYQRDYSWKEENWEDIWNDVVELKNNPNNSHYMGAVVLEVKSDREFTIIDGQQRMATLSLLALAIIKHLKNISQKDIDSKDNDERAQSLRNKFIGEKDPSSLIESSKLFLNESDDSFYQDYLVQLRTPANPRALINSNRLLWECMKFFNEKLSAMSEFENDGMAVARLLSETVSRQLLFIVITVRDGLSAYTVFETLNARGLELSETDLLKNYLFSLVKVETDRRVLQRRWKALVTTVSQEKFKEFLRYHLLCERPDVRKQRLFSIMKEKVKDSQQVFILIDELERRAELFAAIGDPNHAYWIENSGCKQYIRDLRLFRVRQMTPLIFASWEKFSKPEFEKVLKLVVVLSFRYSVVGSLNPNRLEPTYHSAAKAVADGTAIRPSQIFEKLKTAYVEDEKFRQDFALMTVDTGGSGKRLTKYILSKLQADLSSRACDPDTDPASIEHILPENPIDKWDETFDRNLWETFTYRLGNLTLLESNLNREVGNSDYGCKVDAYAKSAYEMATDLTVMAPENWTPELLEHRQAEMSRRAVHIWRSDYA